uniref:Putative DNA polymerase n=1 Tax=viral metagenome TaxID=1070528 RepID=A0A6H1ZVQ7_9ZZZZ
MIENKRTFVPPSGSPSSKYILVGEQPGREEIYARKPFIGPAGRELNLCLQSAGISRLECYVTNVIKDLDKPLKYYIDLSNYRNPTISSEGQEYINLLEKELSKCSANVIVAIGNHALFALCKVVGITKWRGSILESSLIPSRKIIPIIHPATIIPPKNQFLNKHLIVFDLKRAKKEAEFPEIKLISRELIVAPTFHESVGFLQECYQAGLKGVTIDYDIELFNEEVSCISFAISPIKAMSIPFIDSRGDYFSLDQEAEVWKLIGGILEDENIRKRGQNITFDAHFLLRRLGIRARNLDDTMVAQKILFPDYPVGLHFITTMYTDLPYYKDDGKNWYKVGGEWEALWRYNALDSISCAEAFPKQAKDLARQGNIETYERQRKLILPLVYMMERGIKVDVEGMKNEGIRLQEKVVTLQKDLDQVVGRPLNPNSTQQCAQYFYVEKKQKPYMHKGSITTNDDALKRLFRKGFGEADTIRQIRGANKLLSNYFEVSKVDSDGRLRCSYNPVGTRYSRISSSQNIFGTGMNMQNWPHEALQYLLPDEGYIYYAIDMSQIENRIVAYVGNVTQMIDAFEADQDVHRLTASLIFGKPPDEISDEPGSSSLAQGKYSERFWGKKSNHAFNYDFGYKNFALQMEIPENEGRWILDRYHTAYPGVRQKYHSMVKTQLAENRTLTNLFGRKTLFLGQWGDKLFKEAYSCIPQGTTGDKINEQGVNFIYYNQQWFEPIELLVQVHDSIGFQIPLSISWSDHAEMILRIKSSLERPLKWREREFVVPIDLVMGLDMYKDGPRCREIKHSNFPTLIEDLAKRLEGNYNEISIKDYKYN